MAIAEERGLARVIIEAGWKNDSAIVMIFYQVQL
jgi:hypothetical protein